MHPMTRLALFFLVVSNVVSAPAATDEAAGHAAATQTADLLSYTRLYTGAGGETHFEDVSVTFHYQDYGTNIPTVWLSEGGLAPVAGLHFVSMPAGWDGGEWHPAPARQWVIPLSGEMEFQVSDGEKRTLGPGDLLLVEDTEGKGHRSRMVSSSLGVFAVIPVPE